MGADSICIKDMAGLMVPYAAYELVKVKRKYKGSYTNSYSLHKWCCINDIS